MEASSLHVLNALLQHRILSHAAGEPADDELLQHCIRPHAAGEPADDALLHHRLPHAAREPADVHCYSIAYCLMLQGNLLTCTVTA